MADELDRKSADRRRIDRDEEEAAAAPEVEAHLADAERRMRDDEGDAEADDGRERRR